MHYILHYLPLLVSEVLSEMLSKSFESLQTVRSGRRQWLCQGSDLVGLGRNYLAVKVGERINRGGKGTTMGRDRGSKGKTTGRKDLVELEVRLREDRRDRDDKERGKRGKDKKGEEEYRAGDVLVVFRAGAGVDEVLEGSTPGMMVRVESTRRSLDRMFVIGGREAWDNIRRKNEREIDATVLKAGNLVTANREFQALVKIDSLPLRKEVFNAHLKGGLGSPVSNNDPSTPRTPRSPNPKMLPRTGSERKVWESMTGGGKGGASYGTGFLKYIKDAYNASQVEAISAVTTTSAGVTLIKGPPGTGKTTTVVGAINALHIRAMNEYHAGVAELAELLSKGRLGKEDIQGRYREAVGRKPRLLVTAPSNGAVDGIIGKIFKDGFKDGLGKSYNPSIVRVGYGRGKGVEQVSLDVMVDQIFRDSGDASIVEPRILAWRNNAAKLQDEIRDVIARLGALGQGGVLKKGWEVRCRDDFKVSQMIYFVDHNTRTTQTQPPPRPESGEQVVLPAQCPEYKTYVRVLISKVEKQIQATRKVENYTMAKQRQDMQTRHAVEANLMEDFAITFVTLGSCGSPSLQNARKFDVVVVDEAAQSTEPSTLIALGLGRERAVLVGDPMQLPATIFDNEGGRKGGYNRSLFERLEEGGKEVHMLDVQYRMRGMISKFPREEFYDGRLADGDGVNDRNFGKRLLRGVKEKCPCLGEMRVIDYRGQEEKQGMSLVNMGEVSVIVKILEALGNTFGSLMLKGKVGIITPYASQVGAIKRRLEEEGDRIVQADTNTVDGFQGRECEVIILSLVRAGRGEGVGFLEDRRRMNVALTRPREMLMIVSDVQRVGKDKVWGKLFEEARKGRNVVSLGSEVPEKLEDLKDPNAPQAFDALEEGEEGEEEVKGGPQDVYGLGGILEGEGSDVPVDVYGLGGLEKPPT